MNSMEWIRSTNVDLENTPGVRVRTSCKSIDPSVPPLAGNGDATKMRSTNCWQSRVPSPRIDSGSMSPMSCQKIRGWVDLTRIQSPTKSLASGHLSQPAWKCPLEGSGRARAPHKSFFPLAACLLDQGLYRRRPDKVHIGLILQLPRSVGSCQLHMAILPSARPIRRRKHLSFPPSFLRFGNHRGI